MSPNLSILIPAYNRPKHLDDLLSSIFLQATERVEIIVSDDCSPKKEEIKFVLDKWKNNKNNLTYFMQEKNLGEVGNKNFLFDKAQGLFVLYIGDDDLFEKNAISKLLKLIKNNKQNDIFILGHRIQDDYANLSKNHRFFMEYSISGNSLINYGALNFDWFPFHFGHPASYMFRNSAKINIFQSLGFAEDLGHLASNLIRNKYFYFTNKYFFIWRKDNSRDQSNQSNDKKLHIESRILLLKYIKEITKDSPEINFKIKERRFLSCHKKEHKFFFFIRLLNIFEILLNYLHIFLFACKTIIKEKCLDYFTR